MALNHLLFSLPPGAPLAVSLRTCVEEDSQDQHQEVQRAMSCGLSSHRCHPLNGPRCFPRTNFSSLNPASLSHPLPNIAPLPTVPSPLASHDSNPYPNRSRIARYHATKRLMPSCQALAIQKGAQKLRRKLDMHFLPVSAGAPLPRPLSNKGP